MSVSDRILELAKKKTQQTENLNQKNKVFDELCSQVDKLIEYSNEKAKYGFRATSGMAIYDITIDEELEQLGRIKNAASAEVADKYERALEAIDQLNEMADDMDMPPIFNANLNDEKQVNNEIFGYMKEVYDIEFETQSNLPDEEIDLSDDNNRTKNRLKELESEFGDIMDGNDTNDYGPKF